MNRNQNLLPIILACCLYMVTGAVVANEKSPAPYYITDTVPKNASKAVEELEKAAKSAIPKVEVPKVQIPKVEPPKTNNLFKKIASAFRFRKNAQAKEKERVLAIFESLGINDSIAASAENIELLIDALAQRENQHFDSLIAIINDIKNKQPEVITIPPPAARAEEKGDKEPAIAEEPSESKVVTDQDIEDLTNKLLPLIADKAVEDKAGKKKRETLSAIRKVRTDVRPVVYTRTDSAKRIVKRFYLKVKNKAEVFGIHNYVRNSNYDDYKFNALTTIVYNTVFINGKTGNIKDINGWDTAGIINTAQRAGCNVILTTAIQQNTSTESFLANLAAQKKFLETASYLLRLRKAKGINIQFNGVQPGNARAFTFFVTSLSKELKEQNPNYQVIVTVPVYANTGGYNLKALAPVVDRFIANFTAINVSSMGPMTPLKGGTNSMETILGQFLNEDIPPAKIISTVSYAGTKWAVNPGNGNSRFIQPLTYAEIRRRYDWPLYYDNESASAVMDSLNKRSQPVTTIFFDDATSLEKKYDYIIESGLGGVAIDALGYDKGYSELWDALSYKFSAIDTIYLRDSMMGKAINTDLNFFERASRYLTLFGYVLNNPCEVCFENATDTTEYARKITLSLAELNIDSVIHAKNEFRKPEKKFRSRFEFVNHLLSSWLGWMSIFLLIIALAGGAFYLYKIKKESEEWEWKKKMEIGLVSICILLVLSSFTYLFTSDTIPFFGATPKRTEKTTTTASKSTILPVKSTETAPPLTDTADVVLSDASGFDSSHCSTDPEDDCINMPFPTLMGIIVAGMLVGILITRYLIMPLLRKDDMP